MMIIEYCKRYGCLTSDITGLEGSRSNASVISISTVLLLLLLHLYLCRKCSVACSISQVLALCIRKFDTARG